MKNPNTLICVDVETSTYSERRKLTQICLFLSVCLQLRSIHLQRCETIDQLFFGNQIDNLKGYINVQLTLDYFHFSTVMYFVFYFLSQYCRRSSDDDDCYDFVSIIYLTSYVTLIFSVSRQS